MGGGAAANKRRQAQPGQSSRGGKGRVQKHRTGQSQIFTKICRPKILQHEKHTTWKGEQDIFFKNEKDDDERLPDFSMSQRKCESIRGYPCLARLCRLLRQCKPALLQALPGRQSTCSLKQPANGTRRDISSTHLQSSTASIFQFWNDAPLYCRFTQACATPDQNHLCLVMRFVSAECAAFFFSLSTK